MKPGGAKGMEGCGLAGGLKSCGKTRATSDQGRSGKTWEPDRAEGMMVHGGDKDPRLSQWVGGVRLSPGL